jgi:hypothetical protein
MIEHGFGTDAEGGADLAHGRRDLAGLDEGLNELEDFVLPGSQLVTHRGTDAAIILNIC